MLKPSLLFSFIVLIQLISAQEGAPLLTHFGKNSDVEDQSWAICQDNDNVMLFANRKGILSFDGEEWSQNRVRLTPYAMKMNPSDKKIYVGGENDYGFIERDHKGIYRYTSIAGDSANPGMITRIIFDDSLVCFLSDRTLSCYNFRVGRLETRIDAEPGFPFTGMFMAKKNIYLNVAEKGLFRIEGKTLLPLSTGYLTSKVDILFLLPYSDNLVLLGLSNSKLSLFDGLKYYDYQIQDNGYLKENMLSEGICFGDSLYAFSTLGGGALVVEKKSGKVRNYINNQIGLPDDEIFAIGNDETGGMWISHSFGLTRADLSLPVGNFGVYPGLSGNLAAALRYNNELYVATSEGIYYLSREKSYSETEVLREDKTAILNSGKEKASEIKSELVAPKEQQNTRKNIFSRIFGKKSTSAETKTTRNETKNTSSAISIQQQPRFIKETIRKLKSIDYVYKKVAGLNDKCRQLVATPNGLLAATNRGLFVINDHKATVISPGRYINYVGWSSQDGYYPVAASDGYLKVSYKDGKWFTDNPDKSFTEPIFSIIASEKTYWLGGENMAIRVMNDRGYRYDRFSLVNEFSQRYYMNLINDSLFILTETGIYFLDGQKFTRYGRFSPEGDVFTYPLSNIPLIGTGNKWINPEINSSLNRKDLCLLRLFDDIVSVYCDNSDIWIVDRENRVYSLDRKKTGISSGNVPLMIKHITNEKGTRFDLTDVEFERGDNVVNFEIVAPVYFKKNVTEYQYIIDEVMTDWSPWSTETSYSKVIPRAGDYTLKIRARNIWGEVSQPVTLPFVMKAPFTKTTLFYFFVIVSIMVIFFFVVRFREKQLQEKNRILEEKVKERTAQIEAQKEEITSSIAYAGRIQMAMLPDKDLFNAFFSEYFIYFRPRDIVSGDFYWIGENKEHVFLTVADCTGHGVPGAFMSTLGISSLNEIITNNNRLSASSVLNLLREKIKTSLHQTGKEGEAADGMDISFCIIDKLKKSIQFAGAYNPLYFCNNGDIREYKSDRMPIGIHYGAEAMFTNYEIASERGDIMYLFSDGITDQFGGPDGRKFKKAQLKKLLQEIHFLPLSEQKVLIDKEFHQWKGKNEQVDDITIIGVKL